MSQTTPDRPIQVLLIDDEVAYVQVLAKRMAKRGIEATSCYSGDEAIRILRNRDFDVAVLDIKMRYMDGLEVLKIVRHMVPEMRVIMLTGHGGEAEAREAIKLGAFDYLLKPCDFEDLVSRVRKAAGRG